MHSLRKAVNCCTSGYWETNTNYLLGGTHIFAYILGISVNTVAFGLFPYCLALFTVVSICTMAGLVVKPALQFINTHNVYTCPGKKLVYCEL